jgi:hypothetical protein
MQDTAGENVQLDPPCMFYLFGGYLLMVLSGIFFLSNSSLLWNLSMAIVNGNSIIPILFYNI